MKILYYSSPSFADCDFPLVKALTEMGHDVTYLIELSPVSCRRTLFNINKFIPINAILPATKYEELLVYRNYLNLDKVFLVNRETSGFLGMRSYLMTIKVAQFIKRGKYDILHTDILFNRFQVPLYFLGKSWICTIHDPFLHSDEMSTMNKVYRKLCFWLSKKFVILNKKQLNQFCDIYHIPQSKVLVNKLGVYDNIHAFVKKEWKLKKHNVLFFGRITPYKGIEFLCEAIKIVHQEVSDVTLTIAGGGKFYFDISEYERLPYIEIKNHFIDMEELAKLVFESSVVVCPYIEATQSGVIMTAFSMCKPVVATKVGGLGEMVEHERRGLMVEPCNSVALADAIKKLLLNDEELNRMRINIEKEYFEGDNSWGAIANRYITFYSK